MEILRSLLDWDSGFGKSDRFDTRVTGDCRLQERRALLIAEGKPRGTEGKPDRRRFLRFPKTSPIHVPPMPHADHLNRILAALAEYDAPVADAQPVARRLETVKLLDVARAGLHQPVDAPQNVQRGLLVDGA